MGRFVSVTLLLPVFLAAGCADYYLSVDSINDGVGIAGSRSCCVLSGMKDVADDDLRFREFAVYVKRALEGRGYTVTDDFDGADVIVLLSYGMGNGQENYYMDGGDWYGPRDVTTTYGTVERHGGYSTYSEVTDYGYGYDFTGPVSYVDYTCFVRLVAFEGGRYRNDAKKMFWETDIVSTSGESDMRRMFPVLIGGAMPYLGEDTGRRAEFAVRENDRNVRMIKGVALD